MIIVPRAVLIIALVATTGLTTVLGVTDPAAPVFYPTKFLIWNLALAWVPLFMAVGFAALRRSVWQLPCLLGWLAFLPNSVYLVTDLSHLGEGGVELWRHVLQYAFAAWTGIMLGVVSLRLIHARIERDYGVVFGWILVVASIGLCAIGVVIGRFQRWNSWDLVTQPKAVVATTLEWVRSPFAHHQSTGVALAVAAFFGLAYLTVWSLGALTIAPGSADRSAEFQLVEDRRKVLRQALLRCPSADD
jgi:uncharacterized membrane protein